MHPERTLVLEIGSASAVVKPFAERGLSLAQSSVSQVAADANRACGVLIAEGPGRIGSIRACLEGLADIAEDSGLAFAVLVHSSEEVRVVQRVFRELGMQARGTVSIHADIGNAAEFLARWNPGPPLGSPKILPLGIVLKPTVEVLLRRSFHDCDRVYLEPLGGGRDAAGVFCVHAWLRKSIVGPRPLPFFIKFSTPEKIGKERWNYEYYADFYIPFYLRPNRKRNVENAGGEVTGGVGIQE